MRFESHIPEKRGRGSSGCQVRKNIGVGVGGAGQGKISFKLDPLKGTTKTTPKGEMRGRLGNI